MRDIGAVLGGVLYILWTLFFATLFFLFLITDGFSHYVYDAECCSNKDCKPIADSDVIERDGGFFIKSRNELVPFSLTRQGKDDQYHLCVNEITDVRLCFYRKYSGS